MEKALIQWLESFPHIYDVKGITVTINGKTYQGASYHTTEYAPPDAVKPGSYSKEFIYCLGKHKPLRRSSNKVCFTIEGDKREWYVAGYTAEIKPEQEEYNPFGHNFLLGVYDPERLMGAYQNSKIDDGERHPYTRVPIKVEYLTK